MSSSKTKVKRGRGQVFYLQKALGIHNATLVKELNITFERIKKLKEMEGRGDIFRKHVLDLAHALGCQIQYIFIPQKPLSKKIKSPHTQLWEEQKKYILSHSKRDEGWFRYLRNSLRMPLSEVSKKIRVKEDIIIQAESDERDNQFIKEPIQKLIQALGLRCEYIIVPYCCSKQSDIFKHNTHRQDAVKRFRKLSLLPQKPTEGWLRSMRNACGMSQIKLAQHIHNICDDLISQTEIAEKKSQIQPKFLEPILQTLDCRAELIFVPENINFLLNAITHREKNASPKKRKVQKSLKAKKQRIIS